MDINELKRIHEKLYRTALEFSPGLAYASSSDAKERVEQFVQREVDPLLAEMERLATKVTSIADYTWLNDAMKRWQVWFASQGVPKDVRIALPHQTLEPPPSPKELLGEEDLYEIVARKAFFVAKNRRAGLAEDLIRRIRQDPSLVMDMMFRPDVFRRLVGVVDSVRDEVGDWLTAELDLVAEILAGEINFVSRIGKSSYWRLERRWLDELKQMEAYFAWEQRGDGWSLDEGRADFERGIEVLSRKLNDPRIKATRQDFGEIEGYLEEAFCTNGKLDYGKEGTHELVKGKALRLYQMTQNEDAAVNWMMAEDYVGRYYGNIRAAVMERDEDKLDGVLALFDLGQGTRAVYEGAALMVNCFEYALAVYFFDSEILCGLGVPLAKS